MDRVIAPGELPAVSYLNLTDLCLAIAPYNRGHAPARSTIYRWIEKGLPVAAEDSATSRKLFVLRDVLIWWLGPAEEDTLSPPGTDAH